MENLILSINVVLPLFLLMALGFVLNRMKLMTEPALTQMNNVTFRVLLPTLLFVNIYQTDLDSALNGRLMVFAPALVLASFLILMVLVPCIEKENRKRGVMVQAIMRSNFVLFGMPVVTSLFGEGNTGSTALLIAIVIPMFNIFSVIALEVFRGGKLNVKHLLKSIATNPLLIGAFTGIIFLVLDIPLPVPVMETLGDLSSMATPLALMVLGGTFSFGAVRKHIRHLIICVGGRLIVVPAVGLILSIALGYRGVDLAALMAMLASPCAVSSFTMAQQMDGDSELAGQIVVWTCSLSVLTMFFWTFLLKSLGLM